jgi:hypothetical protein
MDNGTTVVAIPTTKILTAYQEADEDGKVMLKNIYGNDLFLEEEKIKTYEDACKVTGDKHIDEKVDMPNRLKAYIKLCTIAKALQGAWRPNWANFDQYKYFPRFKIRKQNASLCVGGANSGSDVGLSCVGSNYVVSGTDVFCGGALASETREIAIYFGEQFVEFWKDYLIV